MGMNRYIDTFLINWKESANHKPLILRGARQTGKTYSIEQLGKKFESMISVNFEKSPKLKSLFEQDLDATRIVTDLAALTEVKITPGSTLIFLDEIQNCPNAITALRYFYEQLPALHVIGAGSLLDFVLEKISVPVGRIEFVYFRPFSFKEYLLAAGKKGLIDILEGATLEKPPSPPLHQALLSELRTFCFYGGMPGVLRNLIEKKDPVSAINELENIISSYRADFTKYKGRIDPDILHRTFDALPRLVGRKTSYSKVDPEARAGQIKQTINLLEKAHVIHKVKSADGGLPLAAGASDKHYKTIFLDVGLLQRLAGYRFEDWLLQPGLLAAYQGSIAEQFIGQELILQEGFLRNPGLFFWERNKPSSTAEVDYLMAIHGRSIPLEIKSGASGGLKSMRLFLDQHPDCVPGIKLSEEPFGRSDFLIKLPLYAISEIDRLTKPINHIVG